MNQNLLLDSFETLQQHSYVTGTQMQVQKDTQQTFIPIYKEGALTYFGMGESAMQNIAE